MNKQLVLGKNTLDSDWYSKAQTFLSDNGCNDLQLEVNESEYTSFFDAAKASLAASTGGDIEIDYDPGIFVVIADQAKNPGLSKCQCQCGVKMSCGGGGGGSAR